MSIVGTRHPEYDGYYIDWEKWRLAYRGGREFIEEYLIKYTSRESDTEFRRRKDITYCPSHSKAAINDIKNAIFQRTTDITRTGGPVTYLKAATGADVRGVDLLGNTMNSFIGRMILPELLSMGKVGVYIDKADIELNTLADQTHVRPYVYLYETESILNWRYDNAQLVALLLKDRNYSTDADTGLPTGSQESYRLLQRTDAGVEVTMYDHEGNETDKKLLALKQIPFVIFEIQGSLMADVADHQIALLNLASSDLMYSLQSNFPFYTEQYDPNDIGEFIRGTGQQPTETAPGTALSASTARSNSQEVGTTQGRRYPKGMDRPQYINPSSEPLKVSMEKQFSIQQEIRQLVNLAVTNQAPRNASAESKSYDERGLEAGLSYIGLELEYGERLIAEIWAEYEAQEATIINYPAKYTLKSDDERYSEADKLEKSAERIPSDLYRREILKRSAEIRVGTYIPADLLEKIKDQIDAAEVVVIDPEVIHQDLEDGILSPETASLARGYGSDEYPKASKAHAERLARIAISQSEGAAAARGIKDAGDPKEAIEEKSRSRETDQEDVARDKTRGKGRANKE